MVRWGEKVVEMTELNDQYAGVLKLQEIRFTGSGMTAGQFLTLKDGNGDTVARHVVVSATENDVLIGMPISFRGIRVDQIPGGAVSIFLCLR